MSDVSATPRRSIGLATAVGLVLGEMIGVGIFLTPAGMAKGLGSFGLVLAVWLGMGAAALCGALCYGELAARFPQAGGLYVYLREEYGPRLAFLCGWMYLLVLDPGLSAALATGIGAYAATLVPGLPPRAVGIAF
ncbi:MAG TPA: amino acid permease, partial [Thermoanaerobaculia bacterium]|nr:amino acid permease [Thermoanaerobaculia bacterium]